MVMTAKLYWYGLHRVDQSGYDPQPVCYRLGIGSGDERRLT